MTIFPTSTPREQEFLHGFAAGCLHGPERWPKLGEVESPYFKQGAKLGRDVWLFHMVSPTFTRFIGNELNFRSAVKAIVFPGKFTYDSIVARHVARAYLRRRVRRPWRVNV